MRLVLSVIGLVVALMQTVVVAAGPDRLAEIKKLIAEYEMVEKKFFETPLPKDPTTGDEIRRYEIWPGWSYIPRFVKLADAKPDDEAAFLCCQWILDRTRNVGNEDKGIFDADQKAWEILAAHHASRPDLPLLCLKACRRDGRAQEQFLRGLLERKDLSRENRGIATLALAEFFANKYYRIESRQYDPPPTGFAKYWEGRKATNWGKELVTANGSKFKAESIALFREVLANYANVTAKTSAPSLRKLDNLGEKATKSLHGLEHLSVGSPAPGIVGTDLHGRPLDLSAYRGRVTMLSFWFTGCGPCMGMIPQEQRLIKKYQGRPFALLSICTDESLEQAQKTAAEHKMAWPCWFDGGNGPIARDWNVRGFPSIYILDEKGVIVAKHLRGDALDTKLAELMVKQR
jgi:thiol-disulfide isomerase/thioredoxin